MELACIFCDFFAYLEQIEISLPGGDPEIWVNVLAGIISLISFWLTLTKTDNLRRTTRVLLCVFLVLLTGLIVMFSNKRSHMNAQHQREAVEAQKQTKRAQKEHTRLIKALPQDVFRMFSLQSTPPSITSTDRSVVDLLRAIDEVRANSLPVATGPRMRIGTKAVFDLGVQAFERRNYEAYQAAIGGLLCICESSWERELGLNPRGNVSSDVPPNYLIDLVAMNNIDFAQQRRTVDMLGEFVLAGCKSSVVEYNQGKFFSATLYTEGIRTLVRLATELESKSNDVFARAIVSILAGVTIAEAHRRLDEGYELRVGALDTPQITITGDVVADYGRPRELDSLYNACSLVAHLSDELIKYFIDRRKGRLWIGVTNLPEYEYHEDEPEEVVRRFRYYCNAMIGWNTRRADEVKPKIERMLDELLTRAQKADAFVKQRVLKYRYRLDKEKG